MQTSTLEPIAAAASSEVRINPFNAPLGAEVLGLDLTQPLDDVLFRRIHQSHIDHHVLVFRNQRITPAQQIAFSRRFGPLQIHVLRQFKLQDHPEILVVSNVKRDGKPVGLGDAGHYWHSDLS
jgi:taurine dioxygenase